MAVYTTWRCDECDYAVDHPRLDSTAAPNWIELYMGDKSAPFCFCTPACLARWSDRRGAARTG